MLTMPWRHMLKEVYRGRSASRALMHHQVRQHVALRGHVLDLGGGHRNTYVEYLDMSAAESFVVLDLQPTRVVHVVGSVTELPCQTESFDTVLCFNLLEHVLDYEAALREIHRVMKPGAVLYGFVPFLIGVHGDPDDYWRYTPNALRALLSKAGFSTRTLEPTGDAFLTSFDLIRPYMRLRYIGRILRVIVAWLALLASLMSSKIAMPRSPPPDQSPLGIWFVTTRKSC